MFVEGIKLIIVKDRVISSINSHYKSSVTRCFKLLEKKYSDRIIDIIVIELQSSFDLSTLYVLKLFSLIRCIKYSDPVANQA